MRSFTRNPFFKGASVFWMTAACGLAATCLHAASDTPAYKDATQPVERRVEDLLSRMTLEEKVGQMTQADHTFLKRDSDVGRYGLGSVLSGGDSHVKDNSAEAFADRYDELQAQALDTRLGIPILYGIDAVHGHNKVKGAVIFPHNIGLGATRDPELVEKIARATAVEVAATGIRWAFAPCVAVVRDERWGRTYEAFGESAELSATMGAAAVRGLQGSDLSSGTSVLACAKHFAADGGTQGGVDRGNAVLDEETFRAVHLPSYRAAIEAGVGSVMASYNSVNGQKVHGDKALLSGVLKGDLGFQGFVVSDWQAINELGKLYSSDVERSINAGIDMVMVPDDYVTFHATLVQLVKTGRVSMDRIDDANRRILTAKIRLGLFEQPFADRSLLAQVGSPEHRALARQAVRESLVLLKNDSGVLPLAKQRRMVVTGSGADDIGRQCGGWTISWQGRDGNITNGTTILQGLRQAAASPTNVVPWTDRRPPAGVEVGIVVTSERPYAEMLGDRKKLDLNPSDVEAVRRLRAAGLKTVVVVLSGRPMILEPILPLADAIVAAWLPGSEGEGIADVLFGDAGFTGKLGHSWPASMAQVPVNADRLGPDTGADPLFAYGSGLEYEAAPRVASQPDHTSRPHGHAAP